MRQDILFVTKDPRNLHSSPTVTTCVALSAMGLTTLATHLLLLSDRDGLFPSRSSLVYMAALWKTYFDADSDAQAPTGLVAHYPPISGEPSQHRGCRMTHKIAPGSA
ncbi:hypothetical protein NEOLEDRAFT_187898 [Neolentinus lepideus HHB14362 ss-1]|uniref:Uncharacterized protein n=1 Tax=Neolentinus lepideus HHB14362 ss-1 TaxID=1314782 RepID=A0A165TQI6_9AGAM|nr:hypothetical protein NEOLEDRAFT_187898 [Neolentinus lepideus HHB14362 ss-1]